MDSKATPTVTTPVKHGVWATGDISESESEGTSSADEEDETDDDDTPTFVDYASPKTQLTGSWAIVTPGIKTETMGGRSTPSLLPTNLSYTVVSGPGGRYRAVHCEADNVYYVLLAASDDREAVKLIAGTDKVFTKKLADVSKIVSQGKPGKWTSLLKVEMDWFQPELGGLIHSAALSKEILLQHKNESKRKHKTTKTEAAPVKLAKHTLNVGSAVTASEKKSGRELVSSSPSKKRVKHAAPAVVETAPVPSDTATACLSRTDVAALKSVVKIFKSVQQLYGLCASAV
tara:strand:- start:8510 stop:9373 length:864 start_codon:yes stop_codon:yes gene_type:complete